MGKPFSSGVGEAPNSLILGLHGIGGPILGHRGMLGLILEALTTIRYLLGEDITQGSDNDDS